MSFKAIRVNPGYIEVWCVGMMLKMEVGLLDNGYQEFYRHEGTEK